jgi:senataxin
MSQPDISIVNQTLSEFCVVGIFKEKGEIPNLITSTQYDKHIMNAIRNKNQTITLWELTKITTEVREFLALKNVEFDPISKLIYQPRYILTETTRKHDADLYRPFFNSIKGQFNAGQMKAIQNISLIKQGIKLLQGPPGTGKTHTLLGIVSALNHYMKTSEYNNRK